ncbi:carbohydrate ABC transporter permease [Marispirochaeta aestuarii]|uniref:carbohydrate ABC transporter permease n=1 Tax=Marispirochaeta aestuarii TaxID=1963862 RepID=UPI0029C6D663|nr:carbohydrate ABC transporter permease [Marispirochaeta aestuarii]
MKLLQKIGFYAFGLFFLVLFGFPFILTLMMSFKSQAEYMSGNYWNIPKEIFFGNYQKVLLSSFNLYFINSILVASIAVFLTATFASLAAYAFAKFRFRFNAALLLLFVVGMMIPVHTTLIPVYQLTRALNLTDKLVGLIGPYVSFGLPVAIYILTSFFREVPDSIQESAIIDGATPVRIYWSIMLPLSTPAISTVAIYNFLHYWNEFIYALTLINTSTKKTLPVGIREFYGIETINIPAVLTAILVGSLPVIIFYLFAQERVINGLSAGAVKG